ncbi:helix-turn-helix transcriptional regulator [Parendozoicomonas haliclonae]|nr:AraC family transcriptional regulator [Parendozoicomonas haliclonae]
MAEQLTSDTTGWTRLSHRYDAVRLQYTGELSVDYEELYRINDHTLLRMIYSEDALSEDYRPAQHKATTLSGYLTFVYKLAGNNTLHLPDKRNITMKPGTLFIAYTENQQQIYDSTPPGNVYGMVMLMIQPQGLESPPLTLPREDWPEALLRLQDRITVDPKDAFEVMDFNESIHICLRALVDSPYQGALQKAYLQAKISELICLTLDNMQQRDRQQEQSTLTPYEQQQLTTLRHQLQHNLATPPTLTELARQSGMSESKLKRVFKNTYGMTVGELIQKLRMERALNLLRSTSTPISTIAEQLGYGHSSNFITAFKRLFGMPPKTYQKQFSRLLPDTE